VDRILTTLPAPNGIGMMVEHLPATEGSKIDRYVLIASSDPKGRNDGAYVAMFETGVFPWDWEYSGSLRVPVGWRLWGVWLDESADWLAVAWAWTLGTQTSTLRVQTIQVASVWNEGPVVEFVNGFPSTTADGVLVEHAKPGQMAKRGDGTRSSPYVIPVGGSDWEKGSKAYSLIELKGARQIFAVTSGTAP
jgi:hypothetical protein